MNCKNCASVVNGNFCANCGQTAAIHRITVRHVLHDLTHAFTHADKGIFKLTRQLVLRPGTVAREYVEGKRKKYFNPLSFLVLTTALSAYLIYHTGYFESMSQARAQSRVERSNQATQADDPAASAKRRSMFSWMDPRVGREMAKMNNENNKLVSLVLIVPLIAFLSWVLFKGSGFTYAENFVLSSFLFGLANIFRIFIFIPLHIAVPAKTTMIDMVFQIVFLFYFIVGFRQFFRSNLFVAILKAIVMFVLFIVLYWVLMIAYAYTKVGIQDLLVGAN